MWYKALIAFMLNRGGFLSARNEQNMNKKREKKKRERKGLDVNTHFKCNAIFFLILRPFLTQLYAGNAKWPHIHLPVILTLVHGQDHLRGHPAWRIQQSISAISISFPLILDQQKTLPQGSLSLPASTPHEKTWAQRGRGHLMVNKSTKL